MLVLSLKTPLKMFLMNQIFFCKMPVVKLVFVNVACCRLLGIFRTAWFKINGGCFCFLWISGKDLQEDNISEHL